MRDGGRTGGRPCTQSGVYSLADGDPPTVIDRSSDEAEATVPVSADHSTLTLAGCDEGSEKITFEAQNAALSAQMKKRQIDRGWIWCELVAAALGHRVGRQLRQWAFNKWSSTR